MSKNILRIEEYKDDKTMIRHICILHAHIDKISPASAKRGSKLSCCTKASKEKHAQERINRAAEVFHDKLRVANPSKILVGEYKGNRIKTEFYCKTHDEIHLAQPQHMLSGEGIYCCRVAAVREVGRKTGPLNGGYDCVWRVLCKQTKTRGKQGNSFLYLYESPIAGINKYGISNNPDKRAVKGKYGKKLIEPRYYVNRDTAILIEQAFKYGFGCDVPKELLNWEGNTELTKLNKFEFLETIEELERKLLSLGNWLFAENYCDPYDLKRTLKECPALIPKGMKEKW